MTDVLFLTSADLTDLASPSEYVDTVRAGYESHGTDGTAKPRTTLTNDEPEGICTGYFAILPTIDAMGGYTYTVGFSAQDAHFVLPLFDATTGQLLAVLDGSAINPYKTGAAGAVGVDTLARPNARTCAIIGSGAQARGQLKATATVRNFETVRVYSPTPANRKAFASEFNDRLSATVTAVDTPSAAIADADVVITATKATEPVFPDDALPDGAHVTAMGQYDPDKQEIPPETIARATYVPDLRARATQDAGAFLAARQAGLITDDHIHAELGEIVAGNDSGRTDDTEITVFDSGGTGIETVAAARMLYEKAKAQNLGQTIQFAPGSDALTGR